LDADDGAAAHADPHALPVRVVGAAEGARQVLGRTVIVAHPAEGSFGTARFPLRIREWLTGERPGDSMQTAANSMSIGGMMIDLREIRSLTDFQRNARGYVERMRETGSPLVLTVKGKAELVVQSAEAYQEILERLERAETVAALRVALDQEARGEARPARG